ncbi:MAG: hypothetical protein R3C14_49450 [Caldilineaceae bacterium]
MINATFLFHSFFYGTLLSGLLTLLVLGSLYINPEMWLGDAPREIQEKHGPMSARAKGQRAWLVVAFFVAITAVVGLSLVQMPTVVGRPLTFVTVFAHLWIMFMLFNLVDLLLIDWLIVEIIRPAFIAQSPLGQLMAERNYGHHFQGFLKGSVGILGVSLLLAGSITLLIAL